MILLQKICSCPDEKIDMIIKENIERANRNATKVERIGILDYGHTNSLFKGFISLDTRIKYGTINIEDYSMKSTDFIYEFCYFVRKHQINNKLSLIYTLEYFINNYFGYSVKTDRGKVFNDIAWQNTLTDEEYFKALENNQISDLKGKKCCSVYRKKCYRRTNSQFL